jgi:orotate phosphoribosyltransferase
MQNWSDDKKKLFEIIKRDAFFRGEFTLSSGKTSNYYLDCRRATLTGEGAYYTARIFLDMAQPIAFVDFSTIIKADVEPTGVFKGVVQGQD